MKKTLTRRHALQIATAAAAVGFVGCRAQLLQTGAQMFNGTRALLTQPIHVPADFVGMHFHRWPEGNPLSPAPTYGYGGVRSHDYSGLRGGICWYRVHQGPNTFDWSEMDVWIKTHASHNKTIIYTIYGTPAWITSSTAHRDPYGMPGGTEAPKNLGALQEFIHAVVTRYNSQRAQIQFLEIWNEPHFEKDYAGFWTGTASQLAAMGRTIYQTAKSADPNISILTPGFTRAADAGLTAGFNLTSPSPAAAQASSLYQYMIASDGAGGTGGKWCDAVAYHCYNGQIQSATMGLEGEALLLKKLLGQMGLQYPIYMTEFGFLPNSAFTNYSIADKAMTLRRYAAVIASLGIQGMYFYAHDNPLDGNPSVNPPVAQAINDINQKIAGNTLKQVTILSNGTYKIQTAREEFIW